VTERAFTDLSAGKAVAPFTISGSKNPLRGESSTTSEDEPQNEDQDEETANSAANHRASVIKASASAEQK